MSTYTNAQTICTPEESALAGSSGYHCFSRGETIGLVWLTVAGLISMVAVSVMFGIIIRNFVRGIRELSSQNLVRRMREPSSRELRPWELIKKPMEVFMLSLFAADLLQSIGVVMELKWIHVGIVRTGALCTAQGVISNLGEAGIPMMAIIIALYTFASVWWSKQLRNKHPVVLASCTVIFMWLFLILFVAISSSVHRHPPFYVPSPYWCWINSTYSRYRVAGENFWLWMAFGTSVLYVPLILFTQGFMSPDDHVWWKIRFYIPRNQDVYRGPSLSIVVAALAYCAPALATSISRFFGWVHRDVKPFTSPGSQYILKGLFTMTGVFDVLVFRYTRQGLLLFEVPKEELVNVGEGLPPAIETLFEDHKAEGNQAQPEPASGGGNDQPEPSPVDQPGPATGGENNQPEQLLNGDAQSQNQKRSIHWFIGLAVLCLVLNVFDVVWISFYLQAATRPNPHTPVNVTPQGWIGYFMMMYPFGFFLGVVNILMILYASSIFGSHFLHRAGTPRRIISYLVLVLVVLPTALILCCGPFFAPVTALKTVQWHQWHHKCDPFAIEVVLHGRLYSSPATAAPTASFYYWKNGVRTEYYRYNLTQNPGDSNSWQLQLEQVLNSPPAEAYPLARNVSYQLSSNTFSASCASSPGELMMSEAATPCLEGSFNPNGYLSFTINNTATNTTKQLEAIDSKWDFSTHDDAPNLLLKEVLAGGRLGSVRIKSAVTNPQDCSSWKVCLASDEDDLFVPIGVVLIQQDAYSRTCTTPNSN